MIFLHHTRERPASSDQMLSSWSYFTGLRYLFPQSGDPMWVIGGGELFRERSSCSVLLQHHYVVVIRGDIQKACRGALHTSITWTHASLTLPQIKLILTHLKRFSSRPPCRFRRAHTWTWYVAAFDMALPPKTASCCCVWIMLLRTTLYNYQERKTSLVFGIDESIICGVLFVIFETLMERGWKIIAQWVSWRVESWGCISSVQPFWIGPASHSRPLWIDLKSWLLSTYRTVSAHLLLHPIHKHWSSRF